MLNSEAIILDSLSDEELAVQFQSGNADALNSIIERYHDFVQNYTKKYFLIGADRDDVMQEGLIGIYKAAKDYDSEKNSSFKTFASMCIKRQIITAIKSATRQKHTPLNSYISLNRQAYESTADTTLLDVIPHSIPTDPETIIINREKFAGIEYKINHSLSKLELQVLSYHLEKRSYQEISVLINRDVKAVDNALQRIKKKIEMLLKDMDE